MDLKNYINVYDDVFPEKVLNKLLKVCKNLTWKEGEVGQGEINKKVRKVNICDIGPFSESMTKVHWFYIIKDIIANTVSRYIEQNKIKTIYSNGIESIQFLKYQSSDHYAWHYDHAPQMSRTLSCIIFLNEDYEGGELCFRNPNGTNEFKIEKKRNRIIIWPSCFLFPHSVAPVKNGERYSIVAWTT